MGSWSKSLLEADVAEGFTPPSRGFPEGRWATTLIKQKAPEPDIKTDVEGAAGVGTIALASLPLTSEAAIRSYAKARFPDLPIEQAVKRYGTYEDRIVYLGDDGQIHAEVPEGWSPGAIARKVATGVGPSLPALGGALGAVAGAPFAGVGAVPGAVLGAGVGETARQGVASLMFGDDPSMLQRGMNVAFEAGTAGIGEAAGRGVAALMDRGAARDIGKLDIPAVNALQADAQATGVQLTPAELTNLRSLRQQQRVLGNFGGSQDVIGDFLKNRNFQVEDAVSTFLRNLSPVAEGEVAQGMGREAAARAVQIAQAGRAAKAKPLYDAAMSSGAQVDIAPVLAQIDAELVNAKGGIKRALQEARTLLLTSAPDPTGPPNIPGGGLIPDTSMPGLHQAKLALDDLIETAGNRDSGLGRTATRKLLEIKDGLLAQMDEASPEYAQARLIFANESPGVAALREGIIGKIANLSDTQLSMVSRDLFNPSQYGPQSVAKARAAIEKADPDAWSAVVRAYLEEAFNKASKEFATVGPANNAGAKWRSAVFGTGKQRAMLQAAMTPDQWASFNQLMRVLEATGRTSAGMSETAMFQPAIEAMRRSSGSGIANAVLAPQRIPGRVNQAINDVLMGRYTEKLAEIITSPEGMSKLKELRKMSPRSRQALGLVGQLLGFATKEGVRDAKGRPTRAIPALEGAGLSTLQQQRALPQ